MVKIQITLIDKRESKGISYSDFFILFIALLDFELEIIHRKI